MSTLDIPPARRRRGRPWIALVAALVLVAAVVTVVVVRRDSAPRYRTVAAATGDVAAQLTTTGTVTPVSQANLSFAITGQVTSVPATVGQQVAAGAVLATVDTTSLDAQVAQANSQLASAEAKLAADRAGQSAGVSTTTAVGSGSAGGSGAGSNAAPAASVTGAGGGSAPVTVVPAAFTSATGADPAGPGDAGALQALKEGQDKVVADQKAVDDALATARRDLDAEIAACAPVLGMASPSTTEGSGAGSGSGATGSDGSGSGGTSGAGPGDTAESGDAVPTQPAAYTRTRTSPSQSDALKTCQAAITRVLDDQQAVAKAQDTLASDENALDAMLGDIIARASAAPGEGATGGSTAGNASGSTASGSGAGPGAGQRGALTSGTSTNGAPTTGSAAAGGSGAGRAGTGSARTGATGAGASSGGTGAGSGAARQTAAPSASQLAADQAAVDAAQAALTSARQNLAQASLVAPFAGTVAAVSLTPGQQVAGRSGTPQVVVLGEGADQVVTQVGESDIGRVRPGDAATVVPDGATGPLPGTVVSVGLLPTGTASPVTYPVTIGLTGTPPALPAGSGASVGLTVASATGVLTVPTSAVRTDASGSTVTILRNGTADTVKVALGAVGASRTQIVSGLQPGDEVVLADLSQPLPSSGTAGLRGLGGGQGGGQGGQNAGGNGGAATPGR